MKSALKSLQYSKCCLISYRPENHHKYIVNIQYIILFQETARQKIKNETEDRSIRGVKASNLCRELWDAGPDERARRELHMTHSINFSSLCRLFQYTHTIQWHTAQTDCNVESRQMRVGPVLTAGWSLPRVFSRMANASLRRFAASLYLFWSLESRKHFHINLL